MLQFFGKFRDRRLFEPVEGKQSRFSPYSPKTVRPKTVRPETARLKTARPKNQ